MEREVTMKEVERAFDLTLAFPQWQGSGRHLNLSRGAEATATVCARFAPIVTVPLSELGGSAFRINKWNAIFDQFCKACEILSTHAPKRLLTAGGDCACDIASIAYLRRLYPDLTVVWIDAHADATTPERAKNGNFHSMPVTALMGHAPEAMDQRIRIPLDPMRFFYWGVRSDNESDRAFWGRGVPVLEDCSRLSGPVHIHLDLDVLEPSEFPYLAYPEPNGMSVHATLSLIEQVARYSSIVGLTITEFAPATEDDAERGAKVIECVCKAAHRK